MKTGWYFGPEFFGNEELLPLSLFDLKVFDDIEMKIVEEIIGLNNMTFDKLTLDLAAVPSLNGYYDQKLRKWYYSRVNNIEKMGYQIHNVRFK